MDDDSDSLLFPKRIFPDDFKYHTQRIIWQMRNGYRWYYEIAEFAPQAKRSKLKTRKNRGKYVR